jgi:hypothetical protein
MRLRHAHFDDLADVLIRHAVVLLVHVDVIVACDGALEVR